MALHVARHYVVEKLMQSRNFESAYEQSVEEKKEDFALHYGRYNLVAIVSDEVRYRDFVVVMSARVYSSLMSSHDISRLSSAFLNQPKPQAHYSFKKSANLTDVELVTIKSDKYTGAMCALELENTIQQLLNIGKVPFFVGCTSGSTGALRCYVFCLAHGK